MGILTSQKGRKEEREVARVDNVGHAILISWKI
jgi:hypothetical protein